MNLITELFNVIARRHHVAYASHEAALNELLRNRDESRSAADERARRRLAHPRFMTSYPDREEQTLQAKIDTDRIAVLKPAMEVIEKLLEIEHNEAIVASLREAQYRTSNEIDARLKIGLHVGANRVVNHLRSRGVNRAHWAALTVKEIDEIGRLILKFDKSRRSEDVPF